MAWPLIQDYQDAIQNPKSCFRDKELAISKPFTDKFGFPIVSSGSFAAVFKMSYRGKNHAVRCFTKYFPDQQERYETLSRFLNQTRLPYWANFEFFTEGIKIDRIWYPILKMEWVDGIPLDRFIERNLNNSAILEGLSAKFFKMTQEFKVFNVAHGDFQHGNILIQNNNIKLVDYDGVYVPQLNNLFSNEVGHPNYQHPKRSGNDFGDYLDNFSAWIIYVSLKILAKKPSIWNQFKGGDDCLIFRRSDLEDPHSSHLFREIRKISDKNIQNYISYIQNSLSYQEISQIVGIDPDIESSFKPSVSPPPLPPLFSEIEIITIPDIANVYINGRFNGLTPLRRKIAFGTHEIEIKLKDYETVKSYIEVRKGEKIKYNKQLKPLPFKGVQFVFIASNPPGVAVYIDGAYHGSSPITLKNLAIGNHTIRCNMQGYQDWEHQFELKPNQKHQSITANLTKLAQSHGILTIDTYPSNAAIFIDSIQHGYSPKKISQMLPGIHEIHIQKSGYADIYENIEIKIGKRHDKYYQLVTTPSPVIPGSIHVKSNIPGASVYLNGHFKGVEPLTIGDLAPGKYIVECFFYNHTDFKETVVIQNGETKHVSAYLTKKKDTQHSSPSSSHKPSTKRKSRAGKTTSKTKQESFIDKFKKIFKK